MADDEPRTGELTTANYGWTKPTVGASDDAWGGYLNSDLDGIDTTVKSVSTVANAAYPATNPSGYQTAAQVTAALPVVTTTTPAMDGTATIGSTGKWADGGHIHPTDTSRYAASNPSNYITAATLPPASTTVLGGVKVDGTTIKAAGDGTISTTVVPLGDNRLINGDMRIDQRWNGASGTAAGYTCDRWQFAPSLTTKGTWQRTTGSVPGFPNCLGFTSNSAYALLAGDFFIFQQFIEADMVSDFAWGSASAQSVTLSFWALSSLTGTFGGSLRNGSANTRAYLFSYSIPVANVWTKIVLTIPGDTTGTWVMSGAAAGVTVAFGFGVGSTSSAPANAWTAGSYFAPTGAVSVVGTNGATFFVTGVKLEVGSVATPYNRQSLAKSMADCQRYYTNGGVGVLSTAAAASNVWGATATLPVMMRAAPTIAFGTLTTNINVTLPVSSSEITANGFRYWFTNTAAGAIQGSAPYTASAEL